jgi:hypothetical protein
VLIGEVDGAPAAALALADGGLAALRPAAARRTQIA